MNRLLERQLKKAATGEGGVDLSRLLAMVDMAYEESDRDRRIKDRAMDELQRELEHLTRHNREDAEARFNVVMDNVGEAVVIIDEHGTIATFNGAAGRTFGYTLDEVIGRNVSMLMPGDTGEAMIVGKGREVVAQRKNGELFPVDLAIGEAWTGKRRQFIGVVRDISERKQAEQELKQSETRFRELVGSASDWFWETDVQHRLTFVSERIASVLGVHASAIQNTTFFELGLSDDPDCAREHAADLDARRPFRDRSFHVGPSQGSDSRTIRISGIPIFSDENEFLGYRGVGVDITREFSAETRARAAQQQLADAIESIIDAIAVYGADDRLVICNRVYRGLFSTPDRPLAAGMPFEQVLRANKDIFDVAGESFEQWTQYRLQLHRRATGEAVVVPMADGRWFLNREYRMADGGVVSVRTDITDMKLKEQEIENLRRRYKRILDSAGEGIVGVDTEGRITFANRMAGTMLLHSSADMVGQHFHGLVQPTAPQDQQSRIHDAYGKGIGCRVNGDCFQQADGQILAVDYYVAPIAENEETITGAVVVFRDATLRLQYERSLADNQRELERLVAERTRELSKEVDVRARTEAALRESRERLKGITDSVFEGVLVVNPAGHVVFANPSAKRLLNADPAGDVEGLPLDTLFRLGEDGSIGFEHSPWRQITRTGGTVRDDDATFVLMDGVKLSVAYACSASAGDGPRSAILSFRDIAALKTAQHDVLQASRMASVGQLAAGIAHEINTPTQYIGDNLRFVGESFADMADALKAAESLARQARSAGLEEPSSAFEAACRSADVAYLLEEIPKAIHQSLEGVAQVGRIVLSMKEFSHPGATSKTMVDINHAIDNTLTVCRNTWKHVAEVEQDFSPSLPLIPCHAGELNQVFLNLIVNAAHAIEGCGKGGIGRIVITTALETDHVIVRVADTGTGVPKHQRDRIFDPFFTTKDVGKGTGQGLAICRDVVVSKHGGRITVGGTEGEGAVFTIWLPLHPDERPLCGVMPEPDALEESP